MAIKFIMDTGLSQAAAYLGELIRVDSRLELDPYLENASKLLVIRRDSSRLEQDKAFLLQAQLLKCVFITLSSAATRPFEFNRTTYSDSTIPIDVQFIAINVRSVEEAQELSEGLIAELAGFFSTRNPATKRKSFPKLPQIPRCPQLVKDTSTLPRLYNAEGKTDFPTVGQNKTPSFKSSKFAMFPFALTLKIIEDMPEVWCKGGNQFGNKAFRYWIMVMEATHKGEPIPEECLRWLKKREGYIARHRKDNRVAGIIAMIKWAGFVDGPGARAKGAEDGSSLSFMLEAIGYKK